MSRTPPLVITTTTAGISTYSSAYGPLQDDVVNDEKQLFPLHPVRARRPCQVLTCTRSLNVTQLKAQLPITKISPRLIQLNLSIFNVQTSILRQLQVFFRHGHPAPHETPH